MKGKEKEKHIRNKKYSFVFVWAFLVISFLGGIIFTVINIKTNILRFDRALEENIGVACQIVCGIMCCILSILGLTISLQNNKFLGIHIGTIYQMRNKNRFDLRTCFIISIVLMLTSAFGHIIGEIVLCIICVMVLIVFDLYLIITEMPYMTVQENAIIGIIKERCIDKYNGIVEADDYQEKEFNDVLFVLICNKNLKWVYDRLKIKDRPEYNKSLLLKLMEIQLQKVCDLQSIETKSQMIEVTNQLLETIKGMITSDFDITEILGENVKEYSYLLTGVLFRLLDNSVSREKTEKTVAQLATSFHTPNEKHKSKWNLYYSVLTIVIIGRIHIGDLSLVNEIQKQLSLSTYFLKKSCMKTRIFIMVSFIMYYLSKEEEQYPKEYKNRIIDFISESGVEDRINKYSWKELFKEFSKNFSITLNDFLSDFDKNSIYYQYDNLKNGAYWLILTDELAYDWYLANYLNSCSYLTNYDFDKILFTSDNRRFDFHLKQLQKELYTGQGREFIPSEKFNRLVSFYCDDQSDFFFFKTRESSSHYFRNYVDLIREKEFDEQIKKASNIVLQDLAAKYNPQIYNSIASYFGFDDSIDLEGTQKLCFQLIDDKIPNSINFDEFFVEWSTQSIMQEILVRSIKNNRTIIKADNSFDDRISELLNQKIAFVTENVVFYTDFIEDPSVREQFQKKIKEATTIVEKNCFFNRPTLVLENAFSFNCKTNLEIVELTDEQVNIQIEQYLRSDGQYVFEDAFVTRDKLFNIIKETKAIYRVCFNYKTNALENGIIVLQMFP